MMMYIIIGIACLVGIIVVVLLLPNSGKQQQKGQKYRFELAAKECTRSDVFTGQEAYGEYTNVLNKIMEESVLSFDLIRTIISPSVSMTDGERIKIIVDLDNKLKENRDKMLDERARFNTVNDAIKRIAALKSTAKK